MKKIFVALLAAMVMFSLVGCESKEEKEAKIKEEVTSSVDQFMGAVKEMDFDVANKYLSESSDKLDDNDFGNLDEDSKELVKTALNNRTYEIDSINVDSSESANVNLTVSAMKLDLANSLYAAVTGEGIEDNTVDTNLKIVAEKGKNEDGETTWLLNIDDGTFSNAVVNK